MGQAAHFAEAIDANGELELIARGELNIVCFRYTERRRNPQTLNTLNRELLMQLQEQGIAAPRLRFLMEGSRSECQFAIIAPQGRH